MSPATAIGFIGTIIGLLLVRFGTNRRDIVAGHAMAAVSVPIGLLSMTGYAYGVEALYDFGPFVIGALHTSVGMVVLTVAILLSRSDY